jgi:hypothetical protein
MIDIIASQCPMDANTFSLTVAGGALISMLVVSKYMMPLAGPSD